MRIRPRFDSRAGPKSWEMSEPTVGRAKPQGRGRRAPLDATDPAILGLLASDARMSLRRIARELGMSPPAITDGVAGLASIFHEAMWCERLGLVCLRLE